MSYLIICTVALLVSGLTLFSGFGLGTLLMPAFALFFPVEVAIAATAIVHLANNLFKVGLVGRKANAGIVLRLALPAAVMAMVGALLLNYFATIEPLAHPVLYPRHLICKAIPKYISGRTSYFQVCLAFHPYPQLIRAVFNLQRFGPPRHFTVASPWPWIDHLVSGLLRTTHSPC